MNKKRIRKRCHQHHRDERHAHILHRFRHRLCHVNHRACQRHNPGYGFHPDHLLLRRRIPNRQSGPSIPLPQGILSVGKSRISNTIRRLRFDHDEMTQAQLAIKVGVTRQTIVAIEKAHYSPSLEVAFLIAQVFDVPLGEIFSYQPKD